MTRYDRWERNILTQNVSGNTAGLCKRMESFSKRAVIIGRNAVDATIAKILAGTPLAQQQYVADTLRKIVQA